MGYDMNQLVPQIQMLLDMLKQQSYTGKISFLVPDRNNATALSQCLGLNKDDDNNNNNNNDIEDEDDELAKAIQISLNLNDNNNNDDDIKDEKENDNNNNNQNQNDAYEDLAARVRKQEGKNNPKAVDMANLAKDLKLNIKQDSLYLYTAKSKKSQRIAIVTHGLNAKPETMEDIVDLLTQNDPALNFTVFLVRLPGHNPQIPANQVQVTAQDWQQSYKDHLKIVSAVATQMKLPVYVVGHSTGCSVNSCVLSKNASSLPNCLAGCIYLAPADGLGNMGQLLQLLPFAKMMKQPTLKGMGKTFAGSNAVHEDIPLCLLDGLDQCVKQVQNQAFKYAPVPMCCLIDPNDPLISVNKTTEVFKKGKANGKVKVLKNSGGVPHMCVSDNHPAMKAGEIKQHFKQFIMQTEKQINQNDNDDNKEKETGPEIDEVD